jgi:BASS family bile acid:Na+ symporter
MASILILTGLVLAASAVQRWARSFSFTAWVLVSVGAALCYPESFQSWGGLPLPKLIVPLIQIIMFGMGTTLSAVDFLKIGRDPWPVGVGIFLQFSVMPVAGYLLAVAFNLDAELAAGVILIGACSGGLASNIMTYLSGSNVALSMAMTLVSTIIAPVATPLIMVLLAGQYMPIDGVAMTLGVIDIMIVPVAFGMLANVILYSSKSWTMRPASLVAIAVGASALVAAQLIAARHGAVLFPPLRGSLVICFGLFALVTAIKAASRLGLNLHARWMDRVLPLVSMLGICAILAIITAQTHSVLLRVGGTIVLVAIAHNFTGYLLGYWGARCCGAVIGRVGYWLGRYPSPCSRVDERDCRTVAFEVGMQNGGMATALAINVLNSPVAALPPNLFGTWQNISGSLLANYWRRKPARLQSDVGESRVE